MRNGIMVPLDGTQFAEAALPLAMYLARRDQLPLKLVTVWEPILPLFDASSWLEPWEREKHRERHKYMAEVAEKVQRASGCPVSVEYLKGRPGDVLPPLPELNGLDMVVMSTHARGPLARVSLGSVADQMVRKGTVPVLLVRPDESGHGSDFAPANPIQRILVPLDGSEIAEKALQESVLTNPEESTDVTLLRVLAFPLPMVSPEGGVAVDVDSRIVRAEREAAQAYLDRVAQRLASWNCRVTTRAVEDTSTWTGIINCAEANGFDLIAMTTHGRGGAARLLLGSIASRVIRTSNVPVLLFRPEKAASPWHDVDRLAGQVVGLP